VAACPDDRIRDYQIVGGPFSGSYGTVVIGKHIFLGTLVAIKRLHDHVRPQVIKDEALKQRQVKSPYVVSIHDFFVEERAIVMEYCPIGLRDLLKERLGKTKGKIPVGEAFWLLAQILQGLSDAHVAGVIHGDIKPDNVRIGVDSHAKLSDFGAARRLREKRVVIPGSTNWMAPEVLAGQTATRESDHFSFGILSYLALTGRHPFHKEDPSCLTCPEDNIRSPDFRVQHPGTFRDDVPEGITDLVMSLLAREPGDRTAASGRLRAALNWHARLVELEAAAAVPIQSAGSPTQSEELVRAVRKARGLLSSSGEAQQAWRILESAQSSIDRSELDEHGRAVLADSLVLQAHILNGWSKFPDSAAKAGEALVLFPRHVGAFFERGYARLQLDQLSDSEADLSTAKSLCRDSGSRDAIDRLLGALSARSVSAPPLEATASPPPSRSKSNHGETHTGKERASSNDGARKPRIGRGGKHG
jgi:serine/threonine protein kinase